MNSIEQGLKERSAPEEYGERRWLEEHFDDVVSEYRGKRIAIHNEEVIASADTIKELDKILTEDFPLIKPFIVYIAKQTINPVFVEMADPFSVEWGNYLQLPPESVERLKDRAWEENKDWISEQLEALGAEWILVCDREVIKWSDNLREFPSQEELKKIAEEHNLFPFVFSQPPLIEESDWSRTR